MGQKCSCLFSKDSDSTYVFQVKEFTNEHKNKTEIHINDEFARFANKKLLDIDNSKETVKSLRDEYYTSQARGKIIRIQKFFIGYSIRKQMKSFLLSELKETERNLIDKIKTSLRKNRLEHLDSDISKFDYEGWKEFYSSSPNEPRKVIIFNNVYVVTYTNDIPTTLYTGEVDIKNKRNGKGILISRDGSKSIGYWKDDKLNGWGRIIDTKGVISDGVYNMNILSGLGRRMIINEWTYVGEFYNNKFHGKGKLETNDFIYEGDFVEDIKEGIGSLHFKSGDIYEGGFQDNKFNGNGQYKWTTGHMYKGEYLDGKFHGQGRYEWKDGGYYEGSYVYGVKEGQGIFRWSNGKIFKGSFKNGCPHGLGVLIKPDGKETKAEFENGKNIERSKNRKIN